MDEQQYYEDLLMTNQGDERVGDSKTGFNADKYWVGTNKPKVDKVTITDWQNWTDSDNDARSPLEADLEDRETPF